MLRSSKVNVDPTTVKLTQTALFTALVFLFTMFVKIPMLNGYLHIGDAFIYLFAALGGGPWALLAAALGASRADVAGGFALYALPSALIKALNAVPFLIAARNRDKILNWATAVSLIPTTLITIGGYFLANWALFDKAYAWADVPWLALQAALSAVVFVILALALDRAQMKSRLQSFSHSPKAAPGAKRNSVSKV